MSYRRHAPYSRQARLLRQRVAALLAPKVSDFDLDRPRLGLSEHQVARQAWPQGDDVIVVTHTNRASAARTAPPTTGKR